MTRHPTELELARAAGGHRCEDLVEHLRWCRRCRSTLADYEWLQDETERTLTAEADGAPVPDSDWVGLRARLQSPGPLPAVGQRAVAVSLAAMVGLIVMVPVVVAGESRARRMAPRLEDVLTPRTPVAVLGDGRRGTPASRPSGGPRHAQRVSLPFVPPPTPPEPQV